jgi:hypothetical protein
LRRVRSLGLATIRREAQFSPALLEEIVAHIDRLRRAHQPTGPDA